MKSVGTKVVKRKRNHMLTVDFSGPKGAQILDKLDKKAKAENSDRSKTVRKLVLKYLQEA